MDTWLGNKNKMFLDFRKNQLENIITSKVLLTMITKNMKCVEVI